MQMLQRAQKLLAWKWKTDAASVTEVLIAGIEVLLRELEAESVTAAVADLEGPL